MKALCEWSGQSYVDMSRPTSQMALRLQTIREDIVKKVEGVWGDSRFMLLSILQIHMSSSH